MPITANAVRVRHRSKKECRQQYQRENSLAVTTQPPFDFSEHCNRAIRITASRLVFGPRGLASSILAFFIGNENAESYTGPNFSGLKALRVLASAARAGP